MVINIQILHRTHLHHPDPLITYADLTGNYTAASLNDLLRHTVFKIKIKKGLAAHMLKNISCSSPAVS